MISLSLQSLTQPARLAVLVLSMMVVAPLCAADEFRTQNITAGTVLRFADQGQHAQTLMDVSGEQQRLPFTVQYANFLGGPAILEAFRANALDIGVIGNTPPIQAQAAHFPLLIVEARQTAGPDYRYAVRPGLAISTLADFRGKKIAYAEGTGRQPYVLKTLLKAGLSRKDVTLVPLRVSDFPDAIRFGQVDIAPLSDAQYGRYVAQSANPSDAGIPEALYQGLPRNLEYLYASQAALKDPAKSAAIALFIKHWITANKWSLSHPEPWSEAYFVKSQGLSQQAGLAIIASQGEYRFPALASLVAQQQETINVIHQAGDLPQALNAAEEFDLRFDPVITAALQQAPPQQEDDNGH